MADSLGELARIPFSSFFFRYSPSHCDQRSIWCLWEMPCAEFTWCSSCQNLVSLRPSFIYHLSDLFLSFPKQLLAFCTYVAGLLVSWNSLPPSLIVNAKPGWVSQFEFSPSCSPLTKQHKTKLTPGTVSTTCMFREWVCRNKW